MKHAFALSDWIAAADCTRIVKCNHARIGDDYPHYELRYVGDQPAQNLTPAPNLLAVEIWIADADFTLLEADPHYAVIWDEDVAGLGTLAKMTANKDKTEKPAKAAKTKTRQFLTGKGIALGKAKQLAREDDDNATRDDISKDLIAYCRGLPKAKQ